jgi:hypothetical protein
VKSSRLAALGSDGGCVGAEVVAALARSWRWAALTCARLPGVLPNSRCAVGFSLVSVCAPAKAIAVLGKRHPTPDRVAGLLDYGVGE